MGVYGAGRQRPFLTTARRGHGETEEETLGDGDRDPVRDADGEDVGELQMRLAGFRGTVPDGDFGPGTEVQVTSFQRDWMRRPRPHGRVDDETFAAIGDFAAAHPIDLGILGTVDKRGDKREDMREDMRVCGEARGLLVETANAQIGWKGDEPQIPRAERHRPDLGA